MEPNQDPVEPYETVFGYRVHLVYRLNQRWGELSARWDELAAEDWDRTRIQRRIIMGQMEEVSRILREELPWIDPPPYNP